MTFTNKICDIRLKKVWHTYNPNKFTPFFFLIKLKRMSSYFQLRCKYQQIQNQMRKIFFLPLGSQGNSYSACPSASCMTRESFALPSHLECTYVNRMSKLPAHITFWVMSLRLSLNAVFLPDGAEALMCVPSIAPTHFWKKIGSCS